MMTSREHFQQISDSIFEGTSLLMDSRLADVFVRDEAVILLCLFLGLLFFKERKLKKQGERVLSNAVGSVVLCLFAAALINSLYPWCI